MIFSGILALACSNIIGAIPTGFLVARWCGIADIRQHGSGNIGATNVARVLGIYFFALVLLLDAGKAFLNIWLLSYAGYSQELIGAGAILHLVANSYSPFLNWSGGKGVASFFGLLIALHWQVAFFAALVWLCIFLVTHTVGAASVGTVLMVPIIGYFSSCSGVLLPFYVVASIWILIRHKNNIKNFLSILHILQ